MRKDRGKSPGAEGSVTYPASILFLTSGPDGFTLGAS